MYCHNGLGLVCDGGLDLGLVDVHGIRADVDEHGGGPGQDNRGRGAGKGKTREDHFIAFFKAAQKRRHLQSGSAAGGEQSALCAEALFDPFVAFLCELPVAADLVRVDSLFNIFKFRSDIRGNVKRYFCHRISFLFLNALPSLYYYNLFFPIFFVPVPAQCVKSRRAQGRGKPSCFFKSHTVELCMIY